MAGKHGSSIAVLRKLGASLHLHWHAHKAKIARGPKPMMVALWQRLRPILRRRWVRRSLLGLGGVTAVFVISFIALWWRLASGPIEFDLATPWLTAAVEQNFGGQYKIQVGGTQFERDRAGHIRLRLRDIIVRDAEGVTVASAPKAEVGFSGAGLLAGNMHAERLSLVGAEMAVRIDRGGNVKVFAGADKHPIATAPAAAVSLPPRAARGPDAKKGADLAAASASPQNAIENFAALLAWIDGLGASGLDGYNLTELGLKDGSLVVDDQRSGQHWNFQNIDLSLTRSDGGGVIFSVASDSEDRPWSLSAAVTPSPSGRAFNLEARQVFAKDLLLAMRMGEGPILDRLPISASLHAEVADSGTIQALRGRVIVQAGSLRDTTDPDVVIPIDRAEFSLDWNAAQQILLVPFQIISGGNRLTLFAQLAPPLAQGDPWKLAMSGGSVVLGAGQSNGDPVIFNRIMVRTRIDAAQRMVTVEQGDLANADTAVALTGTFDFSSSDPRLAIGLASTRMTLSTLKKLWPSFINPPVRQWVLEHAGGGTIERMVIATNAPMSTFKHGGPPVPDGGLSIDIATRDTTVRPIDSLPAISQADLAIHCTGQTATVKMDRGVIDLPSGRKLTLSAGVFNVPETYGPKPPSRTYFHIEGPVPAAGELLAMKRLRDFSKLPFDPTAARGTVAAQVALGFPLDPELPEGSAAYSVTADITNFAADQVFLAQKMEATSLRIVASNQGYQIKGDVKIAGVPATLDYHKPRADADAEVHIRAALDDAARAKFGFDMGGAVTGPIPIKLSGRVGRADQESRFNVDLDLTPARVDNLLPGWAKPAGKAAHASFTLINTGKSARLDPLTIEGSGTQVKGSIELDGSGNIVSAHFPVFSLSEGDKATFKAVRATDGTLRVTMRGEIYDGRDFVKSAMAGLGAAGKGKIADLDLDVRLGTVLGFNGETLRMLKLNLSRRGGQIRSFGLNAKLGSDATMIGDLRNSSTGRQVVYFETGDAGALFRFTDTYARMVGGQMWVAMDAPTGTPAPQNGLLNVRNFTIRGESALNRLVSTGPNGHHDAIKFSRMRAEFTRTPGRLDIHNGVVQGVIGATIDGHIDYAANEVHLSGSFVPLYQLNNVFGQIPIVGFFLGGSKEGLLGVTYEVVGPPGAPRLNINPLSAVAPGLLRKFFEFRNTKDKFEGTAVGTSEDP
jgi:hypothetical protein